MPENRKTMHGVDMCCQHAKLVEIPNSILQRYDAGIINHKYEHTGVIEVIHLGNKEECYKNAEIRKILTQTE